jgi:hypothetical protein
MFNLADLGEEDDPAVVRALGLTVLPGLRPAFVLPCPALKDSCCSVYESRPSTCRNYRCSLLQRFAAGEVAAPAALTVVTKATRGRDRARTAFAALVPNAAALTFAALAQTIPSGDALRADRALATQWAGALLHLAWLKELLRNEFRVPREQDDAPRAAGLTPDTAPP